MPRLSALQHCHCERTRVAIYTNRSWIATSGYLLAMTMILFILSAAPVQAANLLQVRDVLYNTRTASSSAQSLIFLSPSSLNDGFFRLLVSDNFTFTAPIAVSGTNISGFTFSGGVATTSGDTGCTSVANFHCFEIHYSGSGPASTTVNFQVDHLTNPNTEGAYSYILSQYNSSGSLVNQSNGRVSVHNNPLVTAHVPDYDVSNPILISPSDFAITNNPYEPFSFNRSFSIPGVDFYDFYLDDQLVAGNIHHEALSEEYYFFKTLRIDNVIYVLFNYPISEGTHTWYVKAYGVSGSGKSATSGKRSFTVDSTNPQIILTRIDNQILNWITPDRTDIIVRSSNPLFVGKVEALSNIKLSLIDLDSITIYEEDGNWEHRFHNLIPNHRYEVYIAATDKAGNSHVFPQFFITYVPYSIISYIFPTPTPSLRGGIPDVAIYTDKSSGSPREYARDDNVPPPPPSIPPEKFLPPSTSQPVLSSRFLEFFYYLILFGLILHILMTLFGASVPIRQHLPFFWRLLFPFFVIARSVLTTKQSSIQMDRHANTLAMTKTKPLPFTTISIFNPTNLHQKPYLYTSNILGQFNLPDELTSQILLRLTRPGYFFKDQLLAHQTILAISELDLERKDSPNALERLQLTLLTIRWLPLLVADLTGLIACILAFSPFYLTYTLISLQLTYSEYIYPRNK